MPSADAAARLRYHQLHRLGRPGWGRALLGVLAMVTALLLVVPGLLTGVYDLFGEPYGEVSIDPLTPVGLVMVCLSLAAAVPVVVLATRLAQGLDGGWVASVVARIRWRWPVACAGLAILSLGAALAVALLLPEHGGAAVESSAVNEMTDRTVAFALIVLLLIPLQAAGEEYAFRGYLTQAVGGVVPARAGTVVAVVVPAFLFALAHGVQDPPVFIDRFAFGLVAGALVIVTGGLEAGIAMHVLNNWLAFGIALAFGDMDSALNPSGGSWWSIPTTLTQSLVYLGLAVFVARKMGVQSRTRPGILERSTPRV